MQVQLETLEKLERRLSVALPLQNIDAEVGNRLKRVARNAKIQGFRPGKAPMKIVEQNYGAQVREEVLGEQIQLSFNKAANEQNLRVAGYPQFAIAPTEDAAVFKYTATFEVYPEVAVGDISGKEVEKPTVEVTEAEIDKTIDILRKQRTRYNRVERAAANGDRVIIDFNGKIDGVEFQGGSAENYPFALGNGQMLPEFEAGIVGMKEGETKPVTVSFPEDYHGKDVAGKTAVFDITVKNVAEATMPEVNEEFAKMLGIADGDVAKMRAEVRKNVEREVKRRLQAKTKENVMQALLDVTPLEVPQALVQLEIGRLVEQAREDMKSRGFDAGSMPFPPELFAEQAVRRVSLGLILAEVVKANELQAKPEQIKAVVAEFAESYEQPEEVVQWYYADPSRLQGPESLALEDNVVAFVFGKAKTVEKAVSFDELMGNA